MEGPDLLKYWEIYAAGLEYMSVFVNPLGLVGCFAKNSERAAGSIGYLSMLVLPTLQVFAIFVFVLTLSSIILGLSQGAPRLRVGIDNHQVCIVLVGPLNSVTARSNEASGAVLTLQSKVQARLGKLKFRFAAVSQRRWIY